MAARAIIVQTDGAEIGVSNQFGTVHRKLSEAHKNSELVLLDRSDEPGRVSVNPAQIRRIEEIKTAGDESNGASEVEDTEFVEEPA